MSNVSIDKIFTREDEEEFKRKHAKKVGREVKKKSGMEQTLEWETRYPGHMTVKFGNFWFFYVIGTKFDYPKVADTFRTPEAQVAYRTYLEDKYGDGWMFESLIGIDKCDYLIAMIKDIRTEQQNLTLEYTKNVVDEITELSKTLTPDELQAHIDISTNEFMDELKEFKNESEWSKKSKHSKKKAVVAEI